MQKQNQEIQTKQLVNDYLGWRLANEGYTQWKVMNKIDVARNAKTRICLIMRQMAYEFEKRYNSDYVPVADQFSMTQTYLNETFPLILGELFQIKPFNNNELNISAEQLSQQQHTFECNWCRVIALFGFAGSLAVRCYKSEMPGSIADIAEWTCKFLNNEPRMYNWIEKKGGWVKFIIAE
jgi:hypothetical protein